MIEGGIISSALGLIKEKEKQADKASERLHDGFKTQMELTAHQGSWTGDSKPNQVVKEKVVEKEKVKEPEKEEPEEKPAEEPAAKEEDDDKKNEISGMGIFGLAQGASK